ncbi:hypothetical protein ACXYL9_09225 [Qipengyuania sp. CAU 1752]
MKKVVLALGVSLGALSLVACEAQQEQPAAVEPQAEVAPAPVETAPVVAEDALPTDDGSTVPATDAGAETAQPTEGGVAPAN